MAKTNTHLSFIVLMASLMSLVALSIDALLPALEHIGKAIGITNTTDNQLLITMIFLGLGFGQLIFGPLSDSIGRKSSIYIGFFVFVIASFICINATSIEMMVVGRVLQGIGLAAPRTISIAMVRDTFSGDYMAKIMSFIVVIFILVPVVAPAIGKVVLDMYGWKAIFSSQLFFGIVVIFWFYKKQPETLAKSNRKKMSVSLFISGTKIFIKHKQSVVFTIVSGLITGSFMVYLSASQHIFQEQYGLKEEFPYIFAGLAISVGFATFLNGTLVLKYGMLNLVSSALIAFAILPLGYAILFYGQNNPPIHILLCFFAAQFAALGFLFGNLRALAMEPIGHIAGIGAAINGFTSTIMAVPIATYIGSFIHTTALPLFIGFGISGILALAIVFYLKRTQHETA